MSEGEAAHLGWVMAHPARARRRGRAARVFISPKAAGAPDLLVILGGGSSTNSARNYSALGIGRPKNPTHARYCLFEHYRRFIQLPLIAEYDGQVVHRADGGGMLLAQDPPPL